jgi:hypothetical protein
MLIASKYEIPDKCPKNCPSYGQPFDMGGNCFRCPIMNCSPCYDESGNDMRPLRPEDYNSEMAKEWLDFFESLSHNQGVKVGWRLKKKEMKTSKIKETKDLVKEMIEVFESYQLRDQEKKNGFHDNSIPKNYVRNQKFIKALKDVWDMLDEAWTD